MNVETFLKNYAAKIIGVSMIVCNLFCFVIIVKLFYEYHFTSHLYIMMLSDTALLVLSILFSIGIYLGSLIFMDKVAYLKWSLIDLGLVLLAFVIFVSDII